MVKQNIKMACVTGASSGIGEALCYLLASQNIDLMIAGRNVIRLNHIASKVSSQVKVHVFPGDLTNSEDRELLIKNIFHYMPDLVVNNAGGGLYGDALSYEVAENLKILSLNAEAVMEITLETAKAMIAAGKKGTILNVSSAASFTIFPGFSVYSAAKAFVNQFSKSLDVETRPHGIRVLTSCPGMVDTEFRHRASGGTEQKENTSMMSSEFAAKEIWKQVLSGQQVHVFNWKYRVMLVLAKFLPESLVARILYSVMKKRSGNN